MDMAFSDLCFRWHRELFELHDVNIHHSIKLLRLDKDGDWVERDPLFDGTFF